ncbi:MAG: LysM peptidoglycan-binding domain-containing M23 family metallopeptidase [Sphingomonadaceae bacterium]|nr:LysM peptidoglycan-binding domain-containing M23 family metallopeptidase [Sphingomonadaceae bacterium]
MRATAPEQPARTIVVRPGEGLAAIARREGVPLAVLAQANGLADNALLGGGQVLKLPAGRLHRVERGETLAAIARAYRVRLADAAAANRLRPPYRLEIGDLVFLPSPPKPDVVARARANKLDIDRLIAGAQPRPAARGAAANGAQARATATPGLLKPAPARTAAAATAASNAPPASSAAPVPAVAEAPAIRLDWPLTGRLLSGFGRKASGQVNDGINIAAVAGAPVRAAADGEVLYAGSGVAAFGGLILIRHADGWVTAYGHNETLMVAKGDRVTRGQTIARAGATGEVDSPQLHFELRRGRTPVNPLTALPPRPTG